jgi:hypothetical protein
LEINNVILNLVKGNQNYKLKKKSKSLEWISKKSKGRGGDGVEGDDRGRRTFDINRNFYSDEIVNLLHENITYFVSKSHFNVKITSNEEKTKILKFN